MTIFVVRNLCDVFIGNCHICHNWQICKRSFCNALTNPKSVQIYWTQDLENDQDEILPNIVPRMMSRHDSGTWINMIFKINVYFDLNQDLRQNHEQGNHLIQITIKSQDHYCLNIREHDMSDHKDDDGDNKFDLRYNIRSVNHEKRTRLVVLGLLLSPHRVWDKSVPAG